MSFSYTDKQLNQLNWDKNVYGVNVNALDAREIVYISSKRRSIR